MLKSTTDIRAHMRNTRTAHLKTLLRMSRETIRQPTYYGAHLVNGRQGPDYVYCARVIAVIRAELTARQRAKAEG